MGIHRSRRRATTIGAAATDHPDLRGYHLHPWCEPFKQYVRDRLPFAPDSLPPFKPLSMVELPQYAGEPEKPSPPPRQMSPIAIPAHGDKERTVDSTVLEKSARIAWRSNSVFVIPRLPMSPQNPPG